MSNKKVIEDTLRFVRQKTLQNQDRLKLLSADNGYLLEIDKERELGYLQGEKDLARKIELMLMED